MICLLRTNMGDAGALILARGRELTLSRNRIGFEGALSLMMTSAH
jgi:hypothetical protein